MARTKRASRIAAGKAAGESDGMPGVQEQGENVGQESENPNFFMQLHDEDYVRIHRMDDFDKKLVYHGRLAMHEQNEVFVGRTLGGGFYRVQLLSRVDNPASTHQIKGTKTFKLPGRYIPPSSLLGGEQSTPSPSAPSATPEVGTLRGGSPNETLNAALVATVVDMMKTLREPPQKQSQGPQVDWGLIINGALGLMTTMLSRKGDAIDPLVLLKEIKEIVGSPAAAQPASNAIADAVKGLRELMHLKDAVDGKEPPLDAEGAMYATIPKLLDAMLSSRGQTPQQSGQTPPSTIPQLNPGDPLWKQLLLSQRVNLLKGAQMGLEPGFAAEMALRLMPQHAQGVLNEFLAIPDHVELSMQTIPELRQFPHWITSFFAEVVAQLTGEEEEEVTADGSKSGAEGSGASS